MLQPSSKESLQQRVGPPGPAVYTSRLTHLQRGSVPAVEEIGEIGGRERQLAGVSAHRVSMGQSTTQWALTGADAAERRTHFFRAEETEIYASLRALEDRAIQKALIAQPATRGGNLLVIEPPGPIAIPRDADAIPMAPDLLVYAELKYRGTEQALEAAEMILPKVLDDGAH